MQRINILCKRMEWRVLAVIAATVLALTLIGSQAVIARGPAGGGGDGQPTVGAGQPDVPGPPQPHEEETGNNLSFPVIWSDGVELALRGEIDVNGEIIEKYEGCYFCDVYCDASLDESLCPGDADYIHDGCGQEHWYLQQDAGNEWQADTTNWTGDNALDVHWVDWGDNLESRNWYDNLSVRVEMVLLQDLTTPMTAYTMNLLWGQGPSEMHGSDGTTYGSDEARVYSAYAKLTIQKLIGNREDNLTLTWNSVEGKWDGDAEAPTTGPVGLSSEINVSGRVVYGYNWDVKNIQDAAGDWRITFFLDPNGANLNTNFAEGITQIKLPEDGEEAVTIEAVDLGEGGLTGLDCANNLTWIDVRILKRTGPGGSGRR